MIKLSEALPLQRFRRVIAWAMLAAVVTTVLFAADGAYRWFSSTDTQVAAPLPREQSVEAPEPALAAAQDATPPAQIALPTPEPAVVDIQKPLQTEPSTDPIPGSTNGSASNLASGSIPGATDAPIRNEVTPKQTSPKPSHPKRLQVRRAPAKQATHERTTPRQRAQKEKPNVYWERDTQLGYAPQLRKRTCNPASGQMPMQCYYPREGRERFPAKPLN